MFSFFPESNADSWTNVSSVVNVITATMNVSRSNFEACRVFACTRVTINTRDQFLSERRGEEAGTVHGTVIDNR